MPDEDYNPSANDPDAHELQEDADVTRASALANAFREEFLNLFEEAEQKEAEDQTFLLSHHEFDKWATKIGELNSASNVTDNVISMRGLSKRRAEIRETINRASKFGKGVWPPFSIEVHTHGRNFEVRLFRKYLDAIPGGLVSRMKTFLHNKASTWDEYFATLTSERIQKTAPELYHRFIGSHTAMSYFLKSIIDAAENMDHLLMNMYSEGQKRLAADTSDSQKSRKRNPKI